MHGFSAREFAGYMLAEDEYVRFDGLHEAHESEDGIRLADIVPPSWIDTHDQPFEYLDTY